MRSWRQARAAMRALVERPCLRLPWCSALGGNIVAGGISIHAVDVASGRPAQGLRVEIWRVDPDSLRVADGRLGGNGVVDHPVAQGGGGTGGGDGGPFFFRGVLW